MRWASRCQPAAPCEARSPAHLVNVLHDSRLDLARMLWEQAAHMRRLLLRASGDAHAEPGVKQRRDAVSALSATVTPLPIQPDGHLRPDKARGASDEDEAGCDCWHCVVVVGCQVGDLDWALGTDVAVIYPQLAVSWPGYRDTNPVRHRAERRNPIRCRCCHPPTHPASRRQAGNRGTSFVLPPAPAERGAAAMHRTPRDSESGLRRLARLCTAR